MSDHQQHFGNLARAPQICPSLHPPPPQRLPDPQHCCSLGGIVGGCPGVHTHRSWSHPHRLHPHSWSPAAPHGPFGTQRATEWLAWKRPQSPQKPQALLWAERPSSHCSPSNEWEDKAMGRLEKPSKGIIGKPRRNTRGEVQPPACITLEK